jgi:hypothetical protein
MFIVLSNSQEGKQMPEHIDTQTPTTDTNLEPDEGRRGPSATQLAAVVEAAYILEAVRK